MIYTIQKTKVDQIIGFLIGFLYFVFGVVILSNLDLGLLTLAIFLGINLILIGLSKLLNYSYSKKNSKVFSSWDLIIGILGVIMGFIVVFNSSLGIKTFIYLTSFILFIQGIYLISYSLVIESISDWGKKITLISGIIILLLSVIVIVFQGFVIKTFIILLAIGFILNGISKVLASFDNYLIIDDENDDSTIIEKDEKE